MNNNETRDLKARIFFKKDIYNTLVGGVIGIIPGLILWLVMSYLDFVAGIVGFFITAGSLLGYKYFAKNTKQSGIAICIVISILSIFILDVSISSYSLYQKYKNEVSDSAVEDLRKDLVDRLSTMSEEEIAAYLADYDIKSLDDTDGLDRYVRNSYNETFLTNYSIDSIPDSPLSAVKGLKTMLLRDRTLKISKLFLTNLLTGIAFSILAGLVVTHSRFFYKFDIDYYEDD